MKIVTLNQKKAFWTGIARNLKNNPDIAQNVVHLIVNSNSLKGSSFSPQIILLLFDSSN